MDHRHLPMPAAPSSTLDRRLIAVGTITRRGGRTTTVRVTPAGVTGTITPVRTQDDFCPVCEFWGCHCTPWPGAHAAVTHRLAVSL